MIVDQRCLFVLHMYFTKAHESSVRVKIFFKDLINASENQHLVAGLIHILLTCGLRLLL